MGFGRIFRAGKEGRYSLQLRAEFTNIFNRMVYSTPADGATFLGLNNPATPPGNGNAFGGRTGLLSSGFGYVNWFNGAGATPRSGKIIVRFQF
jgi:hypothetical protein